MKLNIIFKEYIWLLNTIYRAKRITFREISDKWKQNEMSGGMPLARSTFNRHKDDIQDIFCIDIECDINDKFKYYISNSSVLEEDSIQNWMFSTLSVNNTISECRSLNDRIILESIATDVDTLEIITEAIKENIILSIKYKKYSSSEEKTYIVKPYCLKLFHRRWYLLCNKTENGEFRTLSFDRMQQVTSTDEHFEKDEDFNAYDYYRDSFGIVKNDNSPTERVVIRAYDTEKYSLKDLPIHSSQKEIISTEAYSDFELYIKVTLDFAGYLVSRAGMIKVVEPLELQEKVRQLHKDALNRYE